MKFDTLSRRLGHQLVAIRQGRGFTQAELSRRSGISLKYISMIESGTNPSLKTVLKLCNALELSLVQLLEQARSIRPPSGKKQRVSPLNVSIPTDCPVFKQFVGYIRKLDGDDRDKALNILRALI